MTLDRKDRYSRRALLKALGLGLGVLPLLESDRIAAAPTGVAKRFISITWTNGIVPQNFYPPAGPLTAPLPPILSPLEPWKSKVLAMRGSGTGVHTGGIDVQVMVDAELPYAGHFTYPALLTGCVPPVLGQPAPSPSTELASIDVLIGNALQAQGFASPRLNLGCRPGSSSTSWNAGGIKNLPQTNPYKLYTTLFGGTPDLLARRQSVLDFCIDDLARFGARLGSEDRPKIDSHLQSLRAIETQLATLPGCHPPTQTPAGLNFSDNNNYPTQVKSMMDMIAAAVKCDVARTFTLDLIDDGGGNSLNFPWLGIPSPDYSAIAHQGAAGYPQKTRIDTWFYSEVAGLVAQLAANPEGAATSLDNSVILVSNDCNEGSAEEVVSIPYLVVGGCAGFFKQGTCVQFPTNVPNNRLLASVCHAMDLPVTSVGVTYRGDLDNVLKA
jgi:Protein of unknown function (DUF1552)